MISLLKLLIPAAREKADYWSWAKVTSLNPLRIKLDGDSDPTPATPRTIVSTDALAVGKRVWCQLKGRTLMVVGVSGGIDSGGGGGGGGAGTVTSVNGQAPNSAGAVTLPVGSVDSVNGQAPNSAGAVSLSASDVGAVATGDLSTVAYTGDYNNLSNLPYIPPAPPSLVPSVMYIGASGAPAFTNGWVNYGSGYADLTLIKDHTNRVFLDGVVKSGTVSHTSGSSSIFMLPDGFRPWGTQIYAALARGEAVAQVNVYSGGYVSVYEIGTGGNNGYIGLSGISWSVA